VQYLKDSSVVRIPAYVKIFYTKRFELHRTDSTCNPYYAYVIILMAGLDSIKRKIDSNKEGYGSYDFNRFDLSDGDKKIKQLSRSLDEALGAGHNLLTVDSVFTERLIEIWIKNKRADAEGYNQLPHPVEFEMYYEL